MKSALLQRPLILGLAASLSIVSPVWGATSLGMPTSGYVYFHKTGADLASHNEAIEHCAIEAGKTMSPVLPGASISSGGTLVAAIILGGFQDDITHASFTANVENCMVVSGWNVVQLDDSEGKALLKLDAASQSAALKSWVGATEIHGVVKRRYESVSDLKIITAGFGESARDSLSLTSQATAIAGRAKLLPPYEGQGRPWTERLKGILPSDPAKIAEGASVIVVRAVTPKMPNSWLQLIYLGNGVDAPKLPTPFLGIDLPVKSLWSSDAKEETYAFAVPAGRWAVAAISISGFCLSTAAFDIAPGDSVFAGSFSSQALFEPDLTLDPARPKLGNSWVNSKLKPANYQNGVHFPCELFPQTLLYKLDIKSPGQAVQLPSPPTRAQ
jgi:hypothetical protein